MKNYLYILCAFLLAFAGCTKDADVEPIAPAPDGNTQVVLTGFSGRGTRTGFGGAEDGAVPFLWSAGDYIWARNTRSEAIAEGGSQATFVFESLETADTYDVFYNLTGPAAATALIPAEQTQQAAGELNLGQNGDFGYATAQNGTFTLEHATSYVWFDTYSSDVTSNLLSITLSVSGGQTIAGEAAFADGKLGDCKGSSSVTLSFGEEGVALPSQSNDTDVFAAMVLYPADLSTATVSIVYKFADGSVYLQTKSGKTLTPGHTLRLSTQIAKSDCKSSGAFFMTEAGVAEELPTEPIGYLKVVTLGESTLSAEELTSIAGNLANGAVIDLGEATFATTEFPMDFTRKTNLQEIALPRNIQTFTPSTYNSGAFYGCKNLTRITFPEGLTAIGQNCFRNCAKLESIELPSSVRTLDIYAFYGCKLLTSVVIPEGVEAIPRFLFDSCTALTDVTLPSTLKSIGAKAFEATGLEEITIPESVTTIESSVFKNCKSLERIQFPDALTAIPANLCNACSALTTINMPSKLETVGNDAFYNCGKLQDVTFPETLKSLDERSFGGCSAFTRIVIDIPEIANYAFWNGTNPKFSWTIDGQEVGTELSYTYTPTETGIKKIVFTVTDTTDEPEMTLSKCITRTNETRATLEFTVECHSEEESHRRPASGASSATWDRVYEYTPAPGQFINELVSGGFTGTETSPEAAVAYAEERMKKNTWVSLGGWGGYIVVGFDHSIDNSSSGYKGGYNFSITGNAFKGSSEPGIVYVMQDTNGNTLPDDEWYELKGSEYGKEETVQDYAVTYYRPTYSGADVQWKDNQGVKGKIDYLKQYHDQPSYYPAWIGTDSYTLYGPCLKSRTYDQSGNGSYWVNGEYDWGYADNFGNDRLSEDDNAAAGAMKVYFKISNAVDKNGQPANLKYIDFIRVQTGVNAKAGWLGENSTEVFGFTDENINQGK